MKLFNEIKKCVEGYNINNIDYDEKGEYNGNKSIYFNYNNLDYIIEIVNFNDNNNYITKNEYQVLNDNLDIINEINNYLIDKKYKTKIIFDLYIKPTILIYIDNKCYGIEFTINNDFC